MSYDGVTPTKFGLDLRGQRHDPLTETVHLDTGQVPIKPVSHVLPFPALDQEDLEAQGIDTSKLVPGAPRVDALGSCVANATTCSLAAECHNHGKPLPAGLTRLPNDPENEEYAIRLYHAISQWPPTDSGSTGLAACQYLASQKVIASWKAATSVQALCSLLQTGTVIEGKPWFNAWFEPDADGIIDGNGTVFDFERAVRSGVAGGHETCISAIDPTGFKISATGTVEQCLMDERNSWAQQWGLRGNYKIHLTTLGYLQAYVDWKQFVVA